MVQIIRAEIVTRRFLVSLPNFFVKAGKSVCKVYQEEKQGRE